MRIYEKPSATAKKVRQVLRQKFPDQRFKVYTSTNAVRVEWQDGPTVPDVESQVSWMESTQSTQHPDVGYVWEGKAYVGAEYIFTSRTLSDTRRSEILDYLQQSVQEPIAGYTVMQWREAELKLKEKNNAGTQSLASDTDPVPKIEAKRLFLVEHQDELTPDQRFKYDLLLNILSQDETIPGVEKLLLRNGHFIDATFSAMAQ
ncbi:LPD29 domain-containing protein [Paenibacillus sp. WLX2291]|uniref:LPD29 domain-containing protein n=1 Tax=Paenibacillus sp. WLX2291 TaxID=3296934 RepID=UPI0039844002